MLVPNKADVAAQVFNPQRDEHKRVYIIHKELSF